MTDVQVSNARRIGFTAVAVALFAVVVHAFYGDTVARWDDHWSIVGIDPVLYDLDDIPTGGHVPSKDEMNRNFRWDDWMWYSWGVPVMALLPMLFLAISEHNSLRGAVRDRGLWVTGFFVCCNITCAAALGEHNGIPTWSWGELIALVKEHGNVEAAREAHYISPLWLLLPLILTTAFVIFGAWRRAVRDATVTPTEDLP